MDNANFELWYQDNKDHDSLLSIFDLYRKQMVKKKRDALLFKDWAIKYYRTCVDV